MFLDQDDDKSINDSDEANSDDEEQKFKKNFKGKALLKR